MKNDPKVLSLKGRLKFLLKDSAVYGGAGAFNKLVALLVFPVMARYFSVEDYGIIDAFSVLCGLSVLALVFGQDSAVARFFYEYETTAERSSVISQSLIIQVLIVIVTLPIIWQYSDLIARVYTNREDLQQIMQLVILQIPFGLMINFSANILKWTFKRTKFLIVNLGSSFSYIAIVVIGIMFYEIDIQDVFRIYLGSRIFFSVLGVIFCASWLTLKFTGRYYKELLKYGTPYGIIALSGALLPALDRFYIAQFLTPIHLGLYAVGHKIAYMLQLPIIAFQTAWGPFYLSLFKEKNSPETYNKVLLLFTTVISTLGLFVILFSRIIIVTLASEKYFDAHVVIMPIVFGLVLMSVGWILSIGIDISKKSSLKIISTSTRLGITATIILVLIKHLGIFGVAIGFFVGHLINLILELLLAYKANSLRFDLRKPAGIILVALIFGLINTLLVSSTTIWLDFLLSMFSIIAYFFMLWLLFFDKANIFKLLKTFLTK